MSRLRLKISGMAYGLLDGMSIMNCTSIKEGMKSKTRHIAARLGCVIPARCQLCSQWGIPHTGREWICDACLARIFSQDSRKSISYKHPKKCPGSQEA